MQKFLMVAPISIVIERAPCWAQRLHPRLVTDDTIFATTIRVDRYIVRKRTPSLPSTFCQIAAKTCEAMNFEMPPLAQ